MNWYYGVNYDMKTAIVIADPRERIAVTRALGLQFKFIVPGGMSRETAEEGAKAAGYEVVGYKLVVERETGT